MCCCIFLCILSEKLKSFSKSSSNGNTLFSAVVTPKYKNAPGMVPGQPQRASLAPPLEQKEQQWNFPPWRLNFFCTFRMNGEPCSSGETGEVHVSGQKNSGCLHSTPGYIWFCLLSNCLTQTFISSVHREKNVPWHVVLWHKPTQSTPPAPRACTKQRRIRRCCRPLSSPPRWRKSYWIKLHPQFSPPLINHL